MTARVICERLNISVSRLNILKKNLVEGKDFVNIHSRLSIYKESAYRKLAARQLKNSKYRLNKLSY